MTPLRQQFIDEMTLRRFSPRTHECYVRWVTELSETYHSAPDKLSDEQIRQYFRSLTHERHLCGSTCLQALNAIVFFYRAVLKREFKERLVPPIKRDSKIPELLNRNEVKAIISHCRSLKYQTALELCYGCGLRVSEVVALHVKDIDGVAKRLHIHQGKGKKDPFVPLCDSQLNHLRNYWRHYHPMIVLFPSREPEQHLDISSMQRSFKAAKRAAGVKKEGGYTRIAAFISILQSYRAEPYSVELRQQWQHRNDL
uniref:tyrosine-type recombinase/integrase n=1 Tax=Vibrio agarivorans TaxID=153622 RepID=UPI0022312176|nr:site-specific integrase [Vibrio agarivorans]